MHKENLQKRGEMRIYIQIEIQIKIGLQWNDNESKLHWKSIWLAKVIDIKKRIGNIRHTMRE
jgi:hypothetical protein